MAEIPAGLRDDLARAASGQRSLRSLGGCLTAVDELLRSDESVRAVARTRLVRRGGVLNGVLVVSDRRALFVSGKGAADAFIQELPFDELTAVSGTRGLTGGSVALSCADGATVEFREIGRAQVELIRQAVDEGIASRG